MENVEIANDNVCHDCSKKIDLENSEIKNGVLLAYNHEGKKINVFKCNECFKNNKSLSNFQECEVYSRVVGYIRPVGQWHKGKKQEYGERQEFKVSGDSCC